jgi:predicted LPLAT superfamily acyltransferase
MRIVAWFYRWIGWHVAHLFVYPVVTYFFLTDHAGRRSSLEYLRRVRAAGASDLNRDLTLRDVYRHYLEFGTTILDRIGFWLARREDFDFSVKGGEALDWVVEEGRGAVVLGSHLGSFDAMRLVAAMRSPIGIKVMMYTQHAARINEVFRQMGEVSGSNATVGVISVEPGSLSHVLEVKRAIARGEVVAILADRLHPGERARGVDVEFLGAPVSLPQGPFLMAAALGCPVLVMAGLRAGNRKYEIHVERFADPLKIPRRDRAGQLQYHAQSYADWLARLCTVAPYQWFNFYDYWDLESPETTPK